MNLDLKLNEVHLEEPREKEDDEPQIDEDFSVTHISIKVDQRQAPKIPAEYVPIHTYKMAESSAV